MKFRILQSLRFRSFNGLGQRAESERGMALILALSMLAILSILGVLALGTSSTEIGISSNYRSSQDAFYAAERAINYAAGSPSIIFSGSDTDLNDDPHPANIAIGSSGLLPDADNEVINMGAGELPAKLAVFNSDDFGASYYRVNATGIGPNGRSQARVETLQARLFKKENDSKLTTTEGG